MVKDANESGKSLWSVVRTIGSISSIVLILWIVLKVFFGILLSDSAVEETTKEVSTRALAISAQLISGQNTIGNEHNQPTTRGYPVSAYTVEGGFFEITVSNVPKSVCDGIAMRLWALPSSSAYINGSLVGKKVYYCGKSNRISFEFSRDLNENISDAIKPAQKHCTSNASCSGCETCRNGRCVSGCRSGENCAQTLKGRSVCCSESNKADTMCCSFIEDGKCCWGRNQCCPKEKPIRLSDGTCTGCYDQRVFGIGEPADFKLCHQLCPNRVDFGADGLCMLPLCQKGQFTDQSGACISCSAAGGYKTSATECTKCPNRTYQNGWCEAPCPSDTVLDAHHNCIPCDFLNHIDLTDSEACSEKCPNRASQPGGCALMACPDGFTPNHKGDCIDCQTPTAITEISEESCAKCPNRIYENGKCLMPCPNNTFRDKNGICVSCTSPAAIPVVLNELECQKCPDRLALNGYCFAACGAGQFRDALGSCHFCSDLGSYPVMQTAICSTCSNRSIFLHQQGNQIMPYCMLQYCPLDYFADKLGACHDCFDKSPVTNTRQAECEKCPNRQWSFVEETCRIKPSCTRDEIIDSNGICQACQSDLEAISVEGHPEECKRCPNRYLFGSWCRKCPKDVRALNTRTSCERCGGAWDNRIQTCTRH